MNLSANPLTTIGGILAFLGTLPLLATASHQALPLWWNSCQFPLFLCGAVGTMLMGIAAKDKGTHSTAAQVEASTVQQAADAVVKKASEPAKEPTQVAIVPPLDPEVLKSPDAAAAEIERLRELLNHPSPEK
jgi:hypothetical protein